MLYHHVERSSGDVGTGERSAGERSKCGIFSLKMGQRLQSALVIIYGQRRRVRKWFDFWAPWTRLAKHRYDLAAKGRDRQRVGCWGGRRRSKQRRSEGLWFSLGRHFRFSWITSTEITSVFEVCDCQSSGWASEKERRFWVSVVPLIVAS